MTWFENKNIKLEVGSRQRGAGWEWDGYDNDLVTDK